MLPELEGDWKQTHQGADTCSVQRIRRCTATLVVRRVFTGGGLQESSLEGASTSEPAVTTAHPLSQRT
eukprot:639462-Pyramimonas_sp.AAC.1